MKLSSESEKVFEDLIKEAWNWDYNPLFKDDSNKLKELKEQHLINTFTDNGNTYVTFTHHGIQKAQIEYMIDIN